MHDPALLERQCRGEDGRRVLQRDRAKPDLDRATALLRALGGPGRLGVRRTGALTEREVEVLALVSQGLTNPQIAGRLSISRNTAAHHVSSLLAKLGVHDRAEAAAWAAVHGGTRQR